HVVAAREVVLDRGARGAVVVAEHLGVLEELAAPDHGPEGVVVDEMIVLTVALAGTRRARGVGHRQHGAGFGGDQRPREARLAGTGRRGEDDQPGAGTGGVVQCVLPGGGSSIADRSSPGIIPDGPRTARRPA